MNEHGDFRPVIRNEGITSGERYLKSLCDRTFLSLWSYPGVYRDQGRSANGDGKEICDLLVVFENDVVIFSDKHCLFPNTGDLQLDWSRWFRKAIKKSAEQAWGAERWILEQPNRIFIDRKCTQRLPVPIPDTSSVRIHAVVVAHDSVERCAREHEGNGGLHVKTDVRGFASHTVPFVIGDLDPARTFVHVLDDKFLEILLTTRDTISDFIRYLSEKEALCRSGTAPILVADSEADVLAWYLMNLDESGQHTIAYGSADILYLDQPNWEWFSTSPQRRAQLEADKISYLWDKLIEITAGHAMDGSSYGPDKSFESSEIILRFLARENRVRRRMLAKAFLDGMSKRPDQFFRRWLKPQKPGEPYYFFLYVPTLYAKNHEDYRVTRQALLQAVARITRLENDNAKDIIGIGVEAGPDAQSSEDFVYYDARDWRPEEASRAREEQEKLQIWIDPKIRHEVEHEFPIQNLALPRLSGRFRNIRCPCGSERKYKKCHGRADVQLPST